MKKLIITVILIVCIAAGWYAIAGEKERDSSRAELIDEATLTLADDNAELPEMNDNDKKILAELEQVFAAAMQHSFYMEGVLSVNDPSDTVSASGNGDFVFYRKDQAVWFRNSSQEMINTKDYSAVADRAMKRIVVMPAKTLEETSAMPLTVIGKNLLSEGYKIEKIEKEGVEIISLVNEEHISCKEIRVEVDKASGHPVLFFYRFTNLDQPDDHASDKTMTIRIRKWENGDAVSARDLPGMVEHVKKGFHAGKNFDDFEIIDLYTK
jgi:hypothetical protein